MATPRSYPPSRGGHKTPFLAVLINTTHDALLEIVSDLPRWPPFCFIGLLWPTQAVLAFYAPTDPDFWKSLYPIKDQYLFACPGPLSYTKTSQTADGNLKYRDLVIYYHL